MSIATTAIDGCKELPASTPQLWIKRGAHKQVVRDLISHRREELAAQQKKNNADYTFILNRIDELQMELALLKNAPAPAPAPVPVAPPPAEIEAPAVLPPNPDGDDDWIPQKTQNEIIINVTSIMDEYVETQRQEYRRICGILLRRYDLLQTEIAALREVSP
jgi:hypothetical protein